MALDRKRTNGSTFGYEPDWAEEVIMRYNFLTVLSSGRLQNEQRKALTLMPQRAEECSFLFETDFVTDVINWLRYHNGAAEEVVKFPVFTEAFRPTDTGNLSGLITINTEDLSTFKNAKSFCNQAIWIDERNVFKPLATYIGLFSDTFVKHGIPFSGFPQSFLGENTVVYPAFDALISEYRVSNLTDKYSRVTLTVQEVLDSDTIVGIGGS